jgi:hypothetical protein
MNESGIANDVRNESTARRKINTHGTTFGFGFTCAIDVMTSSSRITSWKIPIGRSSTTSFRSSSVYRCTYTPGQRNDHKDWTPAVANVIVTTPFPARSASFPGE